MKKLLPFMFFVMLLTPYVYGCAEILQLPKGDAINTARHLMMGRYGVDDALADSFRYEAIIEEGSIVTKVNVYPFLETDEHFELIYWWDGSLERSNHPKLLNFADYNESGQETGKIFNGRAFEKDDAIEAAFHLMIGMYGINEKAASDFRYEAFIDEGLTVTYVDVYPFQEIEKCFKVSYWWDGTFRDSIMPEILDFSEYNELARKKGKVFQNYSLEEKAEYSKNYIPKVEAMLRIKDSSKEVLEHYSMTRHIYGLPSQDDLSESEALVKARKTLQEQFGRSQEWAEASWYNVYFDVTDANQSLWKFYFSNMEGDDIGQYVVRLDSKTGLLVYAFERTLDTSLEELY